MGMETSQSTSILKYGCKLRIGGTYGNCLDELSLSGVNLEAELQRKPNVPMGHSDLGCRDFGQM